MPSAESASTSRLDLYADPLQLLDPFGKLNRAEAIGRLVDEIARDIDALHHRATPGERRLRLIGLGTVDDELCSPSRGGPSPPSSPRFFFVRYFANE